MQIKYTNGIGWGSNMLKSSQEKLQRQAERDSKVAFFEAQKENLKNRESLDLDDIAKKLELLHPMMTRSRQQNRNITAHRCSM